MVDSDRNGLLRLDFWSALCSTMKSHATSMGSICPGWAAERIAEISASFCQQPPPPNDATCASRSEQAVGAQLLIYSISDAHRMMSQSSPDDAKQIRKVVKELCQPRLPQNAEERTGLSARSLAANIKISRIANQAAQDQGA